MAWGYNPFITEKSPYHGAYLAVVESLCKLVASGASFTDVYLAGYRFCKRLGGGKNHFRMFFCSVGIQEFTGNINNNVSFPFHHKAFFLADRCAFPE